MMNFKMKHGSLWLNEAQMKHGNMSLVRPKLEKRKYQRILNINAPRKTKTLLGLPSLLAIGFMYTCVKTTGSLTSNTFVFYIMGG